MKIHIELSEKAMGEINSFIDRICSLCHEARTNGNEIDIVSEIDDEAQALRKKIREQAIIVRSKD